MDSSHPSLAETELAHGASIVQILRPLKDVFLAPDIPQDRLTEACKYADLLPKECLAVCVQSKRTWLQREWGWVASPRGLHWQNLDRGFVTWQRLAGINVPGGINGPVDGTIIVRDGNGAAGTPMRIFVPHRQAELTADLLWQVRTAFVNS